MQKQMQGPGHSISFDMVINQMLEQGKPEEVTIDRKLQKEVYSQVLEILRTLFSWFDLPWRELTFENMFQKVKDLQKIDKEAIRYSKFVPTGMAGTGEEEDKIVYKSKL